MTEEIKILEELSMEKYTDEIGKLFVKQIKDLTSCKITKEEYIQFYKNFYKNHCIISDKVKQYANIQLMVNELIHVMNGISSKIPKERKIISFGERFAERDKEIVNGIINVSKLEFGDGDIIFEKIIKKYLEERLLADNDFNNIFFVLLNVLKQFLDESTINGNII